MFKTCGIGSTRDNLHARGMAQNPGERDGGRRAAVFFGQAGKLFVEFGEFIVPDKNPFKHAVIERRPRLYRDIFQAAVENVKETEQVKNDAEYRLATGQMDNPAEMSIASSQWSMSVNLLIQLRNKALDAYNELMRISL